MGGGPVARLTVRGRTVSTRHPFTEGLRQEVGDLRSRVEALEAENTELRRQGLRLAELLDVVEELLVPIASRDEAGIEDALARYRRSL